VNDTRTSVPPELRALRDATRAYLSVLRDAEPGLGQIADVNRLREPTWSMLVDDMRAAGREDAEGSPARIGRWVGLLLGEVRS